MTTKSRSIKIPLLLSLKLLLSLLSPSPAPKSCEALCLALDSVGGRWAGTVALNFWIVFPSTLGIRSGIGVSAALAICVSLESFGRWRPWFFTQFGLGYFRLSCLGFFVFFILVVLEASGVWHLTSFELVLSIKSVFIRLGPDWFVCCSGRGLGREGSHRALHGEPEKIGRRILRQVP